MFMGEMKKGIVQRKRINAFAIGTKHIHAKLKTHTLTGLKGNHCSPAPAVFRAHVTSTAWETASTLQFRGMKFPFHPPIGLDWVMDPRPHSCPAAVPGWEPGSLTQTLHSFPSILSFPRTCVCRTFSHNKVPSVNSHNPDTYAVHSQMAEETPNQLESFGVTDLSQF